MPPTTELIAKMVRREMAKNPGVGNDVLLGKAKAIDGSVSRMSPRQFHATYRLPALRAAKKANGEGAAPGSRPTKPRVDPAPSSDTAANTSREFGTEASQAAAEPFLPKQTQASASVDTDARSEVLATEPPRSNVISRPDAAEREAVRQILQVVAREALTTESRASLVRLLDSLDERAGAIVTLFRR